jgi:hypothetical protein
MTIDMLPDVPLLEILDFYATNAWMNKWYTLAHVCQKWRNLDFGSPRRVGDDCEMLHIWPPLPIVIMAYDFSVRVDDIGEILEHNDRIHQLSLGAIPSSQSEEALAAMYRPFQSLTWLELAFQDETAPVDPDLFLGGSAPGLQILSLDSIPVSGLPKLLLSATQLVRLEICGLSHSGYILPREMFACLSELTRLKSLMIKFQKSPWPESSTSASASTYSPPRSH